MEENKKEKIALITGTSTQEREKLLMDALEHSVTLQSHYAKLLNQYDGGKRMIFKDANAWISRLTEMEKINENNKIKATTH
jgi:hypothetical protein